MTCKYYYENRRNKPRLPIVYTTQDILQKLDYLAGIHGSKKAAIEAAIIILHATEKTKEFADDAPCDNELSGFTCQHCGETFKDFTHESEFIGWIGVCVKCAMEGIDV